MILTAFILIGRSPGYLKISGILIILLDMQHDCLYYSRALQERPERKLLPVTVLGQYSTPAQESGE